jgi:predicted patatin/cPLA2 family phospholipase
MSFEKICITVRTNQRENMKKYPVNWSGEFQTFLDILLPKLAMVMETTEKEYLEKVDDIKDNQVL